MPLTTRWHTTHFDGSVDLQFLQNQPFCKVLPHSPHVVWIVVDCSFIWLTEGIQLMFITSVASFHIWWRCSKSTYDCSQFSWQNLSIGRSSRLSARQIRIAVGVWTSPTSDCRIRQSASTWYGFQNWMSRGSGTERMQGGSGGCKQKFSLLFAQQKMFS